MKVLFLPSWYGLDKNDPNGSFIRDAALHLAEFGLNVDVLYCDNRQLHKFGFLELFSCFKIRVVKENDLLIYRMSIPKLPKMTRFNSFIWIFFSKKLLKRYLENKKKPDMIHAHSIMWAGAVANFAYLKFHIPFVITEHRGRFVSGSTVNVPKEYQKYLQKICNSAKKVILVSEAQSPFFNMLEAKTKIIPNYVGNHFQDEINIKPFPIDKDIIRLVCVCHLTQQKNVKNLIQATKSIHAQGYKVSLEIVGDGSEMTRLVDLTNNLDLNEIVTFHGLKTNTELPEIFAKCDMMVLPSQFESFGIVLIEAMSCGLPVVATKNGGPQYLISKMNGLVVDTADVKALENGILELHQKPLDRSLIRNYVLSNFTKQKIIPKIVEEYKMAQLK